MEATATVAVMEEPMELAASVVDGDLHVPPLQPLAENGGECLAVAAVAPAPAAEASADGIQAYSFKSFATGLGLGRFVAALEAADLLGNYVDTCESPLTLFAPSDEAFSRLGNLPIDLQVLRELLCVHITLGSLSHAELLNTRSITTISQQTHHVVLADDGGPPRVLQVGSASLVETDVQLPDGRGVLHVIDSVMCCIRLLQHCRYEQVWNKTVRPSPKVGLAGEWRQRQDELHAILIHCDTWQPRFQGLRGSVVPLGGGGSTGEKTHKSFQDGTVHFTELLILEKPPEMSKKKRKKKEDEVGDGSTAIQPASVDGHQSSNYRIMFSLYRRFAAADGSTPAAVTPADPAGAVAGAVAGAPAGAGVAPPGKHLTFCMAPEDILIRNSFHMLSEAEKNSRRAEYKASDGSARGKSGGGRGRGSSSNLQLAGPLPVVTAMYEPAGSSNSAMAVVVPGGGMGGNMVAGRPQPPPELSALSVTAGPHCGGTSIWVQGAHFCGTTQVYIGGALAPQLGMVNENLLTFVSPPASSDGGDVTVDIMATNSDIFGAGHAPVFSNALRFTYSSGVPASGLPMVAMAPATADAAETQTAERALALLAQHAAPHMPVAGDENLLTSASLPRDQRLFATALAVVLGKQPGVAKAENGESPLDRRDDQSRTLLHYCAALKNAPAVELLLRAGASTTVQDAAGQTPLELARAFGWVQGETLLAPVAASTNGTTPMAGAAVAMIDETAAVSVVDASISMDATAEVQVAEVAPTTGAPEVGALLGLGVAP